MDKDELKKLKGKSIFFLLFGIISFIMSFLIPFLWVFSAMAFYIAYENETIGLLHNNGTEPLSIDLSKLNVTFTQVLGAIGSGNAVIEENVLIVDPQTSVVVG